MGLFNLNMLYLPAEGWTYSTPNRRHCLVVWMVSEIYLCDIDEGWNVRYLSSVGRSKSASDCTIAVPYIFQMATCRRGICCYQWFISVASTKNLCFVLVICHHNKQYIFITRLSRLSELISYSLTNVWQKFAKLSEFLFHGFTVRIERLSAFTLENTNMFLYF